MDHRRNRPQLHKHCRLSMFKWNELYRPPNELKNSKKGLINIKNKDNKCFRWCHVQHLNLQEKDPQRIKKVHKKYVEKLDYTGIEFPVNVKQYNKMDKQNTIRINVFGYEEGQPFPIHISNEKFRRPNESTIDYKIQK